MKTILVKENQNIYDIATQHYGNIEAISDILKNNPEIKNEERALVHIGIDTITDDNFYLDVAIKVGSLLLIDNENSLCNENIINTIKNDVTTYSI